MRNRETQIVSFDDDNIDEEIVKVIADGLASGKILAFPTETVYGIGALENQPEALEAIYELKGRAAAKQLAVYINHIDQLKVLSLKVPKCFNELFDRFLPGPLTVIIASKDGTKQGIRYPDCNVLSRLIAHLPVFLKGTSANVSGQESMTTAQEVYAKFKNRVDYIIDGGKCAYGVESTVLDLSQQPYVFLRKGMKYSEIKQFFIDKRLDFKTKKKILVICTGNTCRSPMVSGWLMHTLKKNKMDTLFEIDSCGIYAPFSIAPSQHALSVLQDEDIDLSWHRSKSMTKKLINDADKIIVMTADHKMAVTDLVKDADDKILVFGMHDPMGRGKAYYEETLDLIKEKVEDNFQWIVE
ncbi:MAG: threonylcarbamoyl-AMP synthase [Candidatus Omnitrophica bacterium]|nr:threonylcarbamoyl-AMP synthase [Candidatus Omnitrophota bacterium]